MGRAGENPAALFVSKVKGGNTKVFLRLFQAALPHHPGGGEHA